MAKTISVSTKEQTGQQTAKTSNVTDLVNKVQGVMAGRAMGIPQPTFQTYRKMRENPSIALARMVATAPVRTAEWTLEADDDTPEEQVDFIQSNLQSLWHDLINNALLALDYGYFPGEMVYDASEGQITLARVKPLMVDKTTILTDDHGNFIGLKNEVPGKKVELDLSEAFLYSYDTEAGNLYGRPRHENIRSTAYADWCDIQQKRAKYFKKSAGAIPMVRYPDGESLDAGGAVLPNFRQARNLVQHLQNGDGIMMPTILKPWADQLARDGKAGPEMEAWSVDFLETKAQHGAEFTDAMKHCESLMMRGWLIPERSATEAQTAGSRADSETAADWAMIAADLTFEDIVQTVNQQIINPLLALNFGDKAKGCVRIKRSGLSPALQAFYRALVKETLNQPANVAMMLKLIDINSLISAAGLPQPQEIPSQEDLEAAVASSRPSPESVPPKAGDEPDKEKEMSMTKAMQEVFKAASSDE